MFSTAGYFKGVVCPFYEYGLCHRGYCHYRHSKPATNQKSQMKNQLSDGHHEVTISLDSSDNIINEKPSAVEEVTPFVQSPSITSDNINDSKEKIIEDIFGDSNSDISSDHDHVEEVELIDVSMETGGNDPDKGIGSIETSFNEEVADIEKEFQKAVVKAEVISSEKAANKRQSSEDKYVNQGIKKKRIAHPNAIEVHGSTVSLAKSKVSKKSKVITTSHLIDTSAVYTTSKKRIARTSNMAKGNTTKTTSLSDCTTSQRPKLPLLVNSKVPTKLRQYYLDCYIDELIKSGMEPTTAYAKSLEIEEEIYNKSSSQMIYRSFSSSRLQVTRKVTENVITERRRKSDERVLIHLSEMSTTDSSTVDNNNTKANESFCEVTDNLDEAKICRNLESPLNRKEDKINNEVKIDLSKEPSPVCSIHHDGLTVPPCHMSTAKFYSSKQQEPSDVVAITSDSSNKNKGKLKRPSSIKPSVKSFEDALSVGDKNIKKGKKLKKVKKQTTTTEPLPTTPSHIDTPKCSTNISSTLSLETQPIPKHKIIQPLESQFAPPSLDSLINLTALASGRSKIKYNTEMIKPIKRKFELNPSTSHSKPSFSILKKKEVVFNADVFYNSLSNYLLSEDELVANGYPRPTDSAGMASINIEGRRTSIIEPVNENAVRHYCSRCQKPFLIYNSGGYQSVDECLYHYGRLYKSKEYGEGIVSKYSCCGERRSAPGCQAAQMHVTEGDQQPLLRGCVRSVPPPSEGYPPSVYSLDCEMCYTTKGLELTRVSLVDWNLATIYESLVRPEFPVIDYNTRFSGLTAEDFDGVIKSLPDVQSELLSIIYDDTILIGHSLESDLKALKFIHCKVVDTSIVFPHHKGPPYKRALKSLMAEILHKFIQDSIDGGHDSKEDSSACMELMIWKIKSDLKSPTLMKKIH